MSFELLKLPLHVVENVLSCLGGDRWTLLRCRLVSRKMNNIIFSESLDFMWERMKFYQLAGDADKGCGQEGRDKALSFLAFLHNVADYVTHLRFRSRFEVTVADFKKSFPHLPALKVLDLSHNDWLGTPHLQEIAQKCDIIDVNLRNCPLCNAALAVMSNNWTLMESINIGGCERLTDDDGLVSQFHDTLVALKKYNAELTFVSCDGITDASVLRLLNRDGAVERLTELRLSAWSLTDAAVSSIATCSNLKVLSLSSCYYLTDAALSPLKNLAELKHIHLKGGHHFTTIALEHFFQNASFQLQHLKLGNLPGISDRAMEHVLLRNQGLKSLGLYHCVNVTDTGLQHLRGLSQLRRLGIYSLKGVTSATFDFDADMLPELQCMDLYDTGISEADVDAIRRKLPDVSDMAQLKNVEGRCCTDIPGRVDQ